jgi:hypothetical protein
MKLICPAIKNRKWKIENCRSRGTAEIELLLVIPLLLTLLFITKGTLRLGEARMKNVFDAQQDAYSDAIARSSQPRLYANGSLAPIPSIADTLNKSPDLPNRMHDRDSTVTVTPAAPIPLKPVALTDSAAFAGPAWAYTAWPVHDAGGAFNDATTTNEWFSNYAEEKKSVVEQPLGLAAPTPP